MPITHSHSSQRSSHGRLPRARSLTLLAGQILLGSTACGPRSVAPPGISLPPSSTTTLASPQTPSSSPYTLPEWLRERVYRARLTCGSATTRCHPNVVFVTTILPSSELDARIGYCGGVLISPTHLLTNAHCLPLDHDQRGCHDLLFAHGQASGMGDRGTSQHAACRRVLYASFVSRTEHAQSTTTEQLIEKDAALVELATPLPYEAMPLDLTGLGPSQATGYTAELVTPVTDAPTNSATEDTAPAAQILRRTQCRAPNGTIVAPRLHNPLDPARVLVGCGAVHGNSGSPLFNSDGALAGLVFGSSENPEDAWTTIPQSYGLSPDRIETPRVSARRTYFFATPVGCVPVSLSGRADLPPVPGNLPPETCERAHALQQPVMSLEALYATTVQGLISAPRPETLGLLTSQGLVRWTPAPPPAALTTPRSLDHLALAPQERALLVVTPQGSAILHPRLRADLSVEFVR